MPGNRRKCTAELVRAAVKLKKGGANNADICRAVGIHEATFYRWVKTPRGALERELSESLKKAEADYKNALLGIIAKSAQERDWKAAAWLLERKYPDEYARPEAQLARQAAREAAQEAVGNVKDVLVRIADAAYGAEPDAEAGGVPSGVEGA